MHTHTLHTRAASHCTAGNCINLSNYVVVIFFATAHIRASQHANELGAAAIMLSTITWLYFLRGFPATAYMVRMIIRNIWDMRSFSMICVAFIYGFSYVWYFMVSEWCSELSCLPVRSIGPPPCAHTHMTMHCVPHA